MPTPTYVRSNPSPLRAVAVAALATTPAAQTFVSGGDESIQFGTKVEVLVTAAEVQAVKNTAFVGTNLVATLPDGDLVFHAYTNPGTHGIFHWESDDGTLTEVFDEFQIASAMGLQPGTTVEALDATGAGDLWFVAGESWDPFGAGPDDRHLLEAPLVGTAPGGFQAPTSNFMWQSTFPARSNLRANIFGFLEFVLDDGSPMSDALPTLPGNGLYQWIPGFSAVPFSQESYLNIAAGLSRQGPNLSGATSADDIGVTNMAVGIEKVYLTVAATADGAAPNNDTIAGEPYDGDIVVYDNLTSSSSVLIPRGKYLAVSNQLTGYNRGPGDDIEGINLLADPIRNRLYTFEQRFDPFPPYLPDVVQLMQWNLTTGEFEQLLLTYQELEQPWFDAGFDPTSTGAGFQLGINVAEGSMKLAADGSIIVAVPVDSFVGDDKILRITPDNL